MTGDGHIHTLLPTETHLLWRWTHTCRHCRVNTLCLWTPHASAKPHVFRNLFSPFSFSFRLASYLSNATAEQLRQDETLGFYNSTFNSVTLLPFHWRHPGQLSVPSLITGGDVCLLLKTTVEIRNVGKMISKQIRRKTVFLFHCCVYGMFSSWIAALSL